MLRVHVTLYIVVPYQEMQRGELLKTVSASCDEYTSVVRGTTATSCRIGNHRQRSIKKYAKKTFRIYRHILENIKHIASEQHVFLK